MPTFEVPRSDEPFDFRHQANDYARWRLGSISRSNFQERGEIHYEVRRRYDPENVGRLRQPQKVDDKTGILKYATRCVEFYLLAGDHTAAREMATQVWRQWPAHRLPRPRMSSSAVKAFLLVPKEKDSRRQWGGIRDNRVDSLNISQENSQYIQASRNKAIIFHFRSSS